MKLVTFALLCAQLACVFVPSFPKTFSPMLVRQASDKGEKEITDLNLEEMFEVFEAADKTIDDGKQAVPYETADEAWTKTKAEGTASFLSPALVAALFLTSLGIRFFVFGPDGPTF